ncbi:hypothetical protein [Marinifilum fragile]|uniref:hypothetical protein n=1 Tax=Marinifilum fragile TaxID=570161 RepID=UPI0012F8BF9E|nr:hypothetical protein [Marinifilum fragile]
MKKASIPKKIDAFFMLHYRKSVTCGYTNTILFNTMLSTNYKLSLSVFLISCMEVNYAYWS